MPRIAIKINGGTMNGVPCDGPLVFYVNTPIGIIKLAASTPEQAVERGRAIVKCLGKDEDSVSLYEGGEQA